MIVIAYQVIHTGDFIKKTRRDLTRTVPIFRRYSTVTAQIKEALSERKTLLDEKKALSPLQFFEHRRINARIAEITEELEELKSEKERLMISLGKYDEKEMKNVIVSNGTASISVLDELVPYIDAMNIDLKCFDADVYSKVLGGSLEMTMEFIEEAVKHAHVELTCLIVPGLNDSPEKMREMTAWIASLKDGKDIPFHVSRFFPCFHMTDRPATPVSTVYELAEVARGSLNFVYTGNC
jgi:pyruvate-formate lyase-activating enzyme